MGISIEATHSELIHYVIDGLGQAVLDASHPWRLPVLITENEGRVVVLRAIDAGEGSWRFYTDRRTPKVKQLEASARSAAATFYNTDDRTQLRVSGKALALSEAQHAALWATLSVAQKSSYGASLAPGSKINHAGDGLSQNWSKGCPTETEEQEAFKNFAVYDFKIMEVDLLLLHREGHRRCRWEGLKGDNFKWLVP